MEGAIFGPAGCHRFGFEASDGSPPDRRPRAHRCSCPGASGAGLRHAAAEVSVAEGGMLTPPGYLGASRVRNELPLRAGCGAPWQRGLARSRRARVRGDRCCWVGSTEQLNSPPANRRGGCSAPRHRCSPGPPTVAWRICRCLNSVSVLRARLARTPSCACDRPSWGTAGNAGTQPPRASDWALHAGRWARGAPACGQIAGVAHAGPRCWWRRGGWVQLAARRPP